MEILKHGRVNDIKKQVRFKCNGCGCVFIANDTEFHTYIGCITGNRRYSCKCPECGWKCDY